MEQRFWPAWGAIREGDVETLYTLLDADPDLAKARSNVGHPTLMQALVLDGIALDPETQRSMARRLIHDGSPINEPFVSTGSMGNTVLAEFLAAEGAPLDGDATILRGWSALEEALYWQCTETALRLREIGAKVRNLRIAAGIGDRAAIAGFFDDSGRLLPTAGDTNFSFCDRFPDQVSSAPQDVLDNASVYAASGGHLEIVEDLLAAGASVDALPPGFHVRGSALHYAAMHGHEAVCDLLIEHGADPRLPDGSDEKRPAAAWASYGGHSRLAEKLTIC